MGNCPKCGYKLEEGSKFCTNCGNKMEENKKFCVNCGKEIDAVSKFCTNCGKEVDKVVHKYCINCGFKMDGNSNFCSNCGKSQIGGNLGSNKASNLYTILLISIIVSGISCFLPIFEFLGISINFVYNYGVVADGILLIPVQVVGLILLLCKKRIGVLVFELIASFIFLYDVIHIVDNIGGNIFNFASIGFYLLIISLVSSVTISIIRIVKKDQYL